MLSFEERNTLRRLISEARWRKIIGEEQILRQLRIEAEEEELRRSARKAQMARLPAKRVCDDCGKPIHRETFNRARREGRTPRCQACALRNTWKLRRERAGQAA
jgi:hypothetical protein